MKINYSALRPLDRIDCAGKGPFAVVTRSVTTGVENAFNRAIPVHTATVVEWDGQLLCAEMGPRGIEINPLSKYEESGKRWIINISRHSVFDDKELLKRAQAQVIGDYRHSIEYDYKGLLEFVFKRLKDNPKRFYCSEYYYMLTRKYVDYITDFAVKVSPFDLYDTDMMTGFHKVQGWKK